MQKFVILTQARTGSEYLANLLDSHPDVLCHLELFSHVKKPERFNAFLESMEKKHGRGVDARDMPTLIQHYLDAVFNDGHKAVGFKLLADQMERHKDLAAWLLREDIFVIHLIRENSLDVLLSRERARQTDVWHTPVEVPQVAVTMPSGEDLLRELAATTRVDRLLGELARAKRSITVHYDDLSASPQDTLAPILLSLGLPPCDLDSLSKKINRMPKSEAIANFDEVRETLTGTGYECLLDSAPSTKPQGPLVHLHIPKAGGSTFEGILERNYGGEGVYMAYPHRSGTVDQYACLSYRDKQRFQAVSGHFSHIYSPFMPRNSRYVSIMRHPVNRVSSNYYMYYHHKNHPLGHRIRDNGITIRDFVDPANGFAQDNLQTKYLAGVPLEAPCSEKDFRRACSLVKDGTIQVGILEHYKESVFAFAKRFGWADIAYTHVGKNAKKPDSLSREDTKAVMAFNLYDMQLYSLALERFRETIETIRHDHAEELDDYMQADMPVQEAALYHPWRDTQ